MADDKRLSRRPAHAPTPEHAAALQMLGGAAAALAANVAIGLFSGVVGLVFRGPPQAAGRVAAEASRRSMIVGAATHGAVSLGIAYVYRDANPYFAGAMACVGIGGASNALGAAVAPVVVDAVRPQRVDVQVDRPIHPSSALPRLHGHPSSDPLGMLG